MKKLLLILAASAMVLSAIGSVAYSGVIKPNDPITTIINDSTNSGANIILASSNDDDDDDHDRYKKRKYYGDNDRYDNDDDRIKKRKYYSSDDCDDDDDDSYRGGSKNPAPAGTLAPPKNGLFNDAAPAPTGN